MRNKLIAALIVVCILLAAAVGVLLFLEQGGNLPDASNGESTAGQDHTDAPADDTEETVGISLPTEGEEERAPEVTWDEEEQVQVETAPSVDSEATYDPDENALPELPVD